MDGNDMFITADFIYWEASQDGLQFAQSTPIQVLNTGFAPTSGTGAVYEIGEKWAPGFKVGLGTDLDHDGWDLYAEYTWYKANQTRSTPVFTGSFAVPVASDNPLAINSPFSDVSPILSSTANWNLRLNVIDLEMGRNMYLSPRLTFRPEFGVKGTWLKQNFNASEETFATSITNNGITTTYGHFFNSTTNTMKNWGVGLRGGFDTAWHFCREFSLVGKLAFTGLWETFKVTRVDSGTAAGTTTTLTNINGAHTYHHLRPVVEWMLGFRYEMWTCGDDFHFAFDAGWEAQQWFGQNEFFISQTNGNDLGFQGLNVRVRFDF